MLPYVCKVTLLIDVPVIGRITLPLEEKGEILVPHKPDVDLDYIDWDHLSLEETSATLHLTLKNMNKFDIDTIFSFLFSSFPVSFIRQILSTFDCSTPRLRKLSVTRSVTGGNFLS